MTDNGADLSGIRISDDGSTVVFIRGTAPNRDGWVANPTADPDGPERAVWAARTADSRSVVFVRRPGLAFGRQAQQVVGASVDRTVRRSSPVRKAVEAVAAAAMRGRTMPVDVAAATRLRPQSPTSRGCRRRRAKAATTCRCELHRERDKLVDD
jgi:hypothetical protein